MLVSRVLGGDKSCFGVLVERYQDVLFNLALRTVGDFDEAQDITQTAFIKAYRSLGSFDPHRRFFSWIYRITLNESLNARKSRRPHETIPENLATSAPDALELLARKDRYRQLNSAIGALPDLLRRVIELRHRSELSYREIADVLGIPEKTVKSRLFSARRQLAGTIRAMRSPRTAGGHRA